MSMISPAITGLPSSAATAEAIHYVATDPTVLSRVLVPYKPHCRYLQSATVAHSGSGIPIVAEGEFAIPESCYIDDTGHFNAVEFNICYNQMFYYALAESVRHQLIPELSSWDMDEYWRRQLPDVLIANFTSRFKKPMKSARFFGRMSMLSVRQKNGNVLVDTEVSFGETAVHVCDGKVLIAIVDRTR